MQQQDSTAQQKIRTNKRTNERTNERTHNRQIKTLDFKSSSLNKTHERKVCVCVCVWGGIFFISFMKASFITIRCYIFVSFFSASLVDPILKIEQVCLFSIKTLEQLAHTYSYNTNSPHLVPAIPIIAMTSQLAVTSFFLSFFLSCINQLAVLCMA